MLNIEINNTTDFPVNTKSVHRTVDKFYKFIDRLDLIKVSKELSIAFISNKEIKKMNKIYRGINKQTDVLSFGNLDTNIRMNANDTNIANKGNKNGTFFAPPLYKGGIQGGYAEIIISYEQAKKQAKDKKITIKQEVEKLLIHGLLHLIGYDHRTDKDALEMEGIEREMGQ
ncbi:rRNA maturation RNase YbeY, partial [Patescibacteria group bacterium]